MKNIEKQQENIKILIELAKENPELEIVPMVATECVQGDDFAYWMAEWGTATVDEYYCLEERIYFKSQDYDELIDKEIDYIANDNPDMQEEQIEQLATERVNGCEWIRAIVIHIDEL